MAELRKVYIATRKDAQTRDRVFRALGDEFDITASRPEEAEFIILDCDDQVPPREWVSRKATFVVPDDCRPPIVVAALGGQGDQGMLQRLADAYEGDITVLPMCDDVNELLRTLKRLQAALPFYNSKNAPKPDPAKVREMALALLRALPPGGLA